MELIINTGQKEYDLKDQNGNIIGKIHINPNDPNFVARMNSFANKYAELAGKADKVDEYFSSGDLDKASETLLELDNAIKSEIDILFDAEISKIVFKGCNCLATVNGVPFIERFINAVLPEFKNSILKERKAQNQRVSKYTQKYHGNKKGYSR
ncbi:MAG: hypothetical protein NC223_05525 [Butyrivibrio sp.]|nr:hypothetical protein [Butyrivibrio sp.]